MSTNKTPYLKTLLWSVFFCSQLIATALLAWHLLAQFSFGYSWGYKLLDLKPHIAEFAPINRYKQGFEATTPEDHWRLFSEISYSVQHQGKGLEEIAYTAANGTTTPLMHLAEIIHLQDVANLIDKFYLAGYLSGFIFLLTAITIWRAQWPFPSIKKITLGFSLAAFLVGLCLLLIGPVTVFYWLHTKIFPEGHQWFFYYEESLMTTLMKAPDIFAFIGLELLAVWMSLVAVLTITFRKVLQKTAEKN